MDYWSAYLDWNVIIDLSDGEHSVLLGCLLEAKRRGILVLPYSSTHIEEVDNIAEVSGQTDPLVSRRLNFLACLTDNIYQYNAIDVDSPRLQIESPQSVRATVTEVSWARESSRWASRMMAMIPVEQFRVVNAITAKEMNNLTPTAIIARVENLIKQEHVTRGDPSRPKCIDEMVDWAFNLIHGITNQKMESRISILLSLLDSFGYWPDKRSPDGVFGATKDYIHAAAASYCDFFVTKDKKLRKKCIAVYQYFEVETEVLTPHEFQVRLVEYYNTCFPAGNQD